MYSSTKDSLTKKGARRGSAATDTLSLPALKDRASRERWMNAKTPSSPVAPAPVRINFSKLTDPHFHDEISEQVEQAFGVNGFGAAIITDIPNFQAIRAKVLHNIFKLSKEPQHVLEKLCQPNQQSLYETGWHEKKMNAAFGKSSNKFVSFFSRYPDETVIYPKDPQFQQDTKNIWPTTIPEFKSDLLKLNQLLIPPLQGLLKYFDSYIDKKITTDGLINYDKNKFLKKYMIIIVVIID